MSSGRPKAPHVDIVEANVNIQAVDISRTALDTIGTAERIAEAYGDDRDFANEMIGQAKAHDAYKKLSQTAWAENLKKAKENKIYTAFKGRIGTNGLAMKGTWEEYCQMLGVSDEKANQDIANLNAFGTEALEAMTNAGIGYRDLRQFRKLPEDQRAALIQVAQAGDKDELQELAEELIAKADAEKAAAKAEAEAAKKAAESQVKAAKAEAAANLQAKDQLLATVRERANQAEEKLSRLETQGIPLDDRFSKLSADVLNLGKRADDALIEVANLFRAVEMVLTEAFEQEPPQQLDRDGAIALAQRVRDQGFRLARTVGRIQAVVDDSIYPLISMDEMHLPYTPEDGRPIEG